MASHSGNLAWRILWTEKPGGLQSTGLQRVRHSAAAKSLQSCPTLCNPRDGSPPGSPVPGILQARTLQWVAISFSNAWKWKVKSESEVAQSCLTLCDPMDCSLPGSSVHGIFQARVLEWGTIAFSESDMTEWQIQHFSVIYSIAETSTSTSLSQLLTPVNCLPSCLFSLHQTTLSHHSSCQTYPSSGLTHP